MDTGCTHKDLKGTELHYFNKKGIPVTTPKEAETVRLSVYFDYDQDNYHIQFKLNASRVTVANALIELSRLIIAPTLRKTPQPKQ